MNSTSSRNKAKKTRKPRSGTPWSCHFSPTDLAAIKAIQKKTGGLFSVSEINQRAVRYAAPKLLSGEINILDVKEIDPQLVGK